MLFVIHATDKKDGMPTRAKFYRAHRTHLDHAVAEGVHILTAGPLVADDGETPIGSLFIVEANDRASVQRFCSIDPYQINGVWETVAIHAFVSRRGWAAPDSKGV
jgi:uncharacterized protein